MQKCGKFNDIQRLQRKSQTGDAFHQQFKLSEILENKPFGFEILSKIDR